MKRRANLFHAKKKVTTSLFIKPLFQAVSIFCVLLFFALVALFILQFRLHTEESDLNNQKQELLTFLLDNKNLEAKILYFSAKKNEVKTFAKDDANFLPYYQLLKDILLTATGSPNLQTMSIDKDKRTGFVVNFTDFQKVYEFLKAVESPSFLNKFSQLTLNSFSITQDRQRNTSADKKGYQLQLSGTFYEISPTPYQ